MQKLFCCLFLVTLMLSCTSDKLNTSIVLERSSLTPQQSLRHSIIDDVTDIYTVQYSLRLNATLDSFPILKVDHIDKEIKRLKFYATEIMYALKEQNPKGREKAQYHFQQTYQKIQRLKTKLDPDQQELLNRYLTRVKTDISLLESRIDTL